jgi:hypothetical protein
MPSDADALLQEALTLPARERAGIAARLVASLENQPPEDAADVEAAWAEELEQRAHRATSGEDPGEDWSALRDRLRTKLPR